MLTPPPRPNEYIAFFNSLLMSWLDLACELHHDWRNDVEGLGTLFAKPIPDYRNPMTSYATLTAAK